LDSPGPLKIKKRSKNGLNIIIDIIIALIAAKTFFLWFP
jgi:hypothetical protein